MFDFNEFVGLIMGKATLAQFAATLLFAYVTAAVMLLYRVSTRDVKKENSPHEFDKKYFWRDNAPRIIGNMLVIPLLVRLSQFKIEPSHAVYIGSFFGVISDRLSYYMLRIRDLALTVADKQIGNLPKNDELENKPKDQEG